VLVAIKDFEVRRKKRNFALGALSRLDERSLALIAAIKFRGLQFIQSVRYIVLVEAKNFIIVLVKRYCNRIYSEYTKARERTIMGQKQIESRGSVSFFLKKITEEKSGIVKGKIEETL
jgi:hypothetical protein